MSSIVVSSLRRCPAILALTAGIASAQLSYSTIALTGQPAPGVGGGIVWASQAPYASLTPQGRASVRSTISGGGLAEPIDANFVGLPGSLAPLPKPTDAAPGLPGLSLTFVSVGRAADDGTASWIGFLSGPGVTTANDSAVYSGAPNAPFVVARDGEQAVSMPAGVNYAGFFAPLRNGGSGLVMGYVAGPGVVASQNDLGAWIVQGAQRTLLFRTGWQAPGCPAGVTLTKGPSFIYSPSLSNDGWLAFHLFVQGPGVSTTNEQAIFMGYPGNLNLVARAGSQAPGMPVGVVYASDLSSVGFNNAHRMVFTSHITGGAVTPANDSVLWSGILNAIAPVAREGDQAPGLAAGIKFGELSTHPRISGGNHLLVGAALTGPGVTLASDTAWWVGMPGSLAIVAREGDQAPGCPTGVVLADLATVWPAVNANGRAVMRVTLAGPGVTSTNNVALYGTGPQGALRLIARTGDPLQLAQGDARVVTNLDATGFSGGQDGNQSALSDADRAIFTATFDDGTSAAIITDLNSCYANCDQSSTTPVLNVNDFTCFLNKFAASDTLANCDGSTAAPVLNVNDFTCFLNKFAVGCF